MAKIKIKINKDEVVAPVVETPTPTVEEKVETVDVPIVEEKVEAPVPSRIEFPEGKKTGKFHSVTVKDGYVVYNPDGSRISGIITLIQANDIVRQQNQAAHIKG